VAFAFGLAAASFFPAILMGIFYTRMNMQGAISGMVTGILFTAGYIVYFAILNPELNTPDNWLFGISPEGIGTLGMLLNTGVALTVSRFTPAPPDEIRELVQRIRIPRER
jgi:cation/acetate symporter